MGEPNRRPFLAALVKLGGDLAGGLGVLEFNQREKKYQ
jgi:hypothetical protein